MKKFQVFSKINSGKSRRISSEKNQIFRNRDKYESKTSKSRIIDKNNNVIIIA